MWIPSKAGGRLSVGLSGATSIEIQGWSGEVLNAGTEDVDWGLTSETWGEFIIVADSPAAGQITASFTQVFWSRQTASRASKPLIPYNFWYWPCTRLDQWARDTTKVLQRYGAVIDKTSPDPGVFEYEFHQLDHAPGWQGHCHNAAPASAVFEQPDDQILGMGTKFNSDEMKLLGAEFFGNFGLLKVAWLLHPQIEPDDPTRFGMLAYLKPSGPRTLPELVERLTGELGAEAAQTYATAVFQKAGNDAAFATQTDQAFGRSGAEFFDALLQQIAVEGQPLVVNLRSYSSAGGPDEVWNQVCFHVFATYVETEGASDKLDVGVYCNLTSNIDKPPPTTGRPAKVSSSGSVEPGTSNDDCLQYLHQLRLVFSEDGVVDRADSRNRWIAIRNSSGDPLFAPTHIQRITLPRKDRPEGITHSENFALGNPVVGQELLDKMILNRRFR